LSQSVATMGGDDAALTIIEYPLRNIYYCRPPKWSWSSITTYDHFVHLILLTSVAPDAAYPPVISTSLA
jgi:hypothetical protein